MKCLQISLLLLTAKLAVTSGSNFIAPALPPSVPVTSYAGFGFLPRSLYSPAVVPNYAPAVAPLVPRFLPEAPVVAPAPIQPFAGPFVPTGYAAPSPLLPAPFGLQARSIHAVAAVPPVPIAVAR